MRRFVLACAWLAFGAMSAAPAFAGGRLEVSVLGGGRGRYAWDSHAPHAGGSYGGVLEYLPTPRLGVAFGVVQTTYDLGHHDGAASATEFALTLRGHLAPEARVAPYATWGLAAYRLRERKVDYSRIDSSGFPLEEENRMAYGSQAGLGFEFPMVGAIRLAIEGQFHMIASVDAGGGELAGFARITAPLVGR